MQSLKVECLHTDHSDFRGEKSILEADEIIATDTVNAILTLPLETKVDLVQKLEGDEFGKQWLEYYRQFLRNECDSRLHAINLSIQPRTRPKLRYLAATYDEIENGKETIRARIKPRASGVHYINLTTETIVEPKNGPVDNKKCPLNRALLRNGKPAEVVIVESTGLSRDFLIGTLHRKNVKMGNYWEDILDYTTRESRDKFNEAFPIRNFVEISLFMISSYQLGQYSPTRLRVSLDQKGPSVNLITPSSLK